MEVAHGFQYVHSFEKHRAAIKQVVYNRQTKKFVSLDMKGLRMWDLKREHKAIRFKKITLYKQLYISKQGNVI